jgi:hypothetical protein
VLRQGYAPQSFAKATDCKHQRQGYGLQAPTPRLRIISFSSDVILEKKEDKIRAKLYKKY